MTNYLIAPGFFGVSSLFWAGNRLFLVLLWLCFSLNQQILPAPCLVWSLGSILVVLLSWKKIQPLFLLLLTLFHLALLLSPHPNPRFPNPTQDSLIALCDRFLHKTEKVFLMKHWQHFIAYFWLVWNQGHHLLPLASYVSCIALPHFSAKICYFRMISQSDCSGLAACCSSAAVQTFWSSTFGSITEQVLFLLSWLLSSASSWIVSSPTRWAPFQSAAWLNLFNNYSFFFFFWSASLYLRIYIQ